MPDAIITSTESTFGTISGTFAADQSTISGTILGPVAGNLSGSVGVPGPAGVGVPAGGLEGQIIVKASETDYDTVWVDNAAETLTATVRNETGATLTKGTVVYINGAAGNKATVTKASAATESGSSKTFAILKDDIPNNQNGTAVTVGLLKGVDTSAFSPGANLWLSTTAGQITQTMPTSPNHAVFLGNAVRIHANQGEIEVRIQNGLELGELHDVLIHDVANGQVLKYDSAQGLWVNGTDSAGVAWGGITGTLSDQTDLQTALDGKYSTSNPAGYITSSALTGYATESFVTSQGYITSAALSPYLLSSTAASTFQTIAGMSSYLTTSAAASTYYPLTNPSGYITSSALAGYATESWVTAGFYPLSSNPAGYLTSASLSGYATESWVTSELGSYLTTSAAASTYLTQSNAASTYQTIAGMSSYLTTATAASTYAPLASPALTGNPTAPTPATADNDTSIATTAFVKAQGYLTSAPVTSVAGKTGAVTLVVGDVSGAAPLASPTFTGTPAAPTASAGTSTTQLATTAFVTTADNLKANLASPALTGTPTAPTATAGTNTTQIATTAFVQAAVPAAATHIQSLQFSSTSAYTRVIDASSQLIAPSVLRIWPSPSNYNGTSTSGAGASALLYLTGYVLSSPSAGVAGNARAFHGNIAGDLGYMMWGGSSNSQINFSRRVSMAFRFSQFPSSTSSVTRVLLGKIHGTAVGDLTSRGIGVKYVPNGSNFDFQLQVHDGTTLTSVTSSTQYAGGVADLEVVSDGAGNAVLYLNGAQVASTTGAPTGTTSANATVFAEIESQATTTNKPVASIGRLYVNTLNF